MERRLPLSPVDGNWVESGSGSTSHNHGYSSGCTISISDPGLPPGPGDYPETSSYSGSDSVDYSASDSAEWTFLNGVWTETSASSAASGGSSSIRDASSWHYNPDPYDPNDFNAGSADEHLELDTTYSASGSTSYSGGTATTQGSADLTTTANGSYSSVSWITDVNESAPSSGERTATWNDHFESQDDLTTTYNPDGSTSQSDSCSNHASGAIDHWSYTSPLTYDATVDYAGYYLGNIATFLANSLGAWLALVSADRGTAWPATTSNLRHAGTQSWNVRKPQNSGHAWHTTLAKPALQSRVVRQRKGLHSDRKRPGESSSDPHTAGPGAKRPLGVALRISISQERTRRGAQGFSTGHRTARAVAGLW